ncbi:uncharacterized protein PAC_17328 [Phialocephala subalpina]|uniref:Uncharacterized protein n=1 Tax=Phialocephala subalpina TaxID=576137 RepID=A0A1L7XQZ6_9HELO|nr:uncharacterized protein PAC_17328 [Phialocephala subalpina]
MLLPFLLNICLTVIYIKALPSPDVNIILQVSEEKPQSFSKYPTVEILEKYGAHITGCCEGVAWCKHYDFCYYGICYDLPWWTILEADQSNHVSSSSTVPHILTYGPYCGWRESCMAGTCYFAGYGDGWPEDQPDEEPEPEPEEPEDDCDPEFGDDCPCTTNKDCHPEDTCVNGLCFSAAFRGGDDVSIAKGKSKRPLKELRPKQ